MSSEVVSDNYNTDGKIVVVAFVIGGIIGFLSNPQDPISGSFAVGIFLSGIAWLSVTKSGRQFLSYMDEQQQQQHRQQQSVVGKKENGPQRICPHCGWQNPKKNNFCHDCGTEFASAEPRTSDTPATTSELREKYVSGEIDDEELDEGIEEAMKRDE